jgi:hypothetical protein
VALVAEAVEFLQVLALQEQLIQVLVAEAVEIQALGDLVALAVQVLLS